MNLIHSASTRESEETSGRMVTTTSILRSWPPTTQRVRPPRMLASRTHKNSWPSKTELTIKLLNVSVMMQKEGADHRDSPENCWCSTDTIFLIEWMTCLSWSGGKCPHMWMRHLWRWSESALRTEFSNTFGRRSFRFPPFPLSRMLLICP